MTFCPNNNIIIAGAKSEVNAVSPRTGRPPKEITKNINLGLRLTKETADKLQWCADTLEISRTEVIEKGIDLVEAELKK